MFGNKRRRILCFFMYVGKIVLGIRGTGLDKCFIVKKHIHEKRELEFFKIKISSIV